VNAYLTLRRASHASSVAIAALVAVNAIPLVGVLFLGWDLATLVAVYWAENGVVGLYAIARMLTAGRVFGSIDRGVAPQPPPPPSGGPRLIQTVALAAFFCVHYGIFWVVHGIFVWFVLPMVFSGFMTDLGPGSTLGPSIASPFDLRVTYPDAGTVLSASFFLLISHGVSFVANWLIGGEHLTSTPEAEMKAPYTRVFVLHLTILFGAFGAALLGARRAALVVLVVLKTGVDLGAHLAERRRASARMAPPPPPVVRRGLDAPSL
jgi:uncharacterized protein DUF6498